MKLQVNGEPYTHKGSGALDDLLDEMTVNAGNVAVMVNDEVVAKERVRSIRLKDGDSVEVLTYAGGG